MFVGTQKNRPSLVLVKPSKTRPYITERLLMGRKESNQTKTKEPSQRNACVCVFKRIFFVRLGPSVRLEENNNLNISCYQTPFSSNYWKLAVTCLKPTRTSSWKELNIQMGPYLSRTSNCYVKVYIGFEIWDRTCAQNWMSGNSYPSLVKLLLHL